MCVCLSFCACFLYISLILPLSIYIFVSVILPKITAPNDIFLPKFQCISIVKALLMHPHY